MKNANGSTTRSISSPERLKTENLNRVRKRKYNTVVENIGVLLNFHRKRKLLKWLLFKCKQCDTFERCGPE